MSGRDHAIGEMTRRGMTRGGEVYLTPEAAAACVRICEDDDVAVIGLEGYLIDEASTVPLLDQIADFSGLRAVDWLTFRTEVNREALEFIEDLPRRVGLLIALTLLSREEWERDTITC